MRRLIVSAVTLALLLAACSSSSKSGAPETTVASSTTGPIKVIPPPEGLPAFYAVPDPLPAKTGTLIKSEKVAAEGVDGTVYRVMYTSENIDGDARAVTGVIVVPKSAPPASGYPVVTWGHGTNGMADICAPSLEPENAVPLVNDLLDHGWLVTASDYEGEGTPGLMPYIAGISAARNTIDIVRAARNLPAAHAGDRYVVWGHSEGGQTAMFGLNIGAKYAPELKMQGVVAGAPPSQLNLVYSFLKDSPYRHYLLMAAGGLNAAYGDTRAPLEKVLKPAGMKLLPKLEQMCAGDLGDELRDLDVSTVEKGDPFKIPEWRIVISENDPKNFTEASPVPLLMIQGGEDQQIPVVSTQLLAQHLCDIDQVLQRWIYPGQTHSGVLAPSSGDMIHWIADRFAGGPNPDPYKPTGQPDVQTTTCGGAL